MEKVRKRRERIYKYLVEQIGDGNTPTVREICEALGIRSTSTVHADLRALADDGLILKQDSLNRSIRLPGRGGATVPLVGTVAAGQPILAVENIEQYLQVSIPARGRELFALRVQGESMKDAAILPDDIVIVERGAVARNGQIVVAMVEDEATVKRFYKEDGHFRLQPENDAFEPIIVDEVLLLGRVVSVWRSYE